MQLRYRYRLYPAPAQERALARVFGCARVVYDGACGTVHDRDINAAKNILALGRGERLNACGGDVRPGAALAVAGEAGTLRGAA